MASDFESAYHFFALGETTWVTSEGATQLAGWNNVLNGIIGIINIFCMTLASSVWIAGVRPSSRGGLRGHGGHEIVYTSQRGHRPFLEPVCLQLQILERWPLPRLGPYTIIPDAIDL